MFCIATSVRNASNESVSATRSSSPSSMDIASTASSECETIASADSDIIYIEPKDLDSPKLKAIRFDDEEAYPVNLQLTPKIKVTPALSSFELEAAQTLANLAEKAKGEPSNEEKKVMPLPVRLALEKLSYVVDTKWHSTQQAKTQNPIEQWDFSSSSSSWDNDSDMLNTWPSPPTTPPNGDDMHPPDTNTWGSNPGSEWEINRPNTHTYSITGS